jgi:hypothetical protein
MTIHDSDVSLPSTGSAQALRSPVSSVLSRRCDSLMPISLRFVAFAIAIPWQHTAFLSLPTSPCAFPATGLELVHPATPARVPTHGDIRGSQVPVEPHLSVCPCSRDPGRTDDSDRLRNVRAAPAHSTAKAPTIVLSRLSCMASELAVYASWCWLPIPTQDSLPAAGQALPDGTFTRKGSAERFPS